MSQETQSAVFPSRKRRHFKGYRRVKVILFALGVTGVLVGLGLSAGYHFHHNMKLVKIGILYVLASLIVLGLRGIMIYIKHSRGKLIK